MPESTESIADRVRAAGPGLAAMLAEAEHAWRARTEDLGAGSPGWRPFEDAFPTFYQFTNRPR
ncbi:multiple cyclophane-containing RiPP AmcA [Rugosimonospora acidiphila]|uniref:multiple cyclophane-containing RiPP AmcA n=1 Tax=Rugosimonospora acidiphila TaxID=556531 RepID=UPI0031EE8BCF